MIFERSNSCRSNCKTPCSLGDSLNNFAESLQKSVIKGFYCGDLFDTPHVDHVLVFLDMGLYLQHLTAVTEKRAWLFSSFVSEKLPVALAICDHEIK